MSIHDPTRTSEGRDIATIVKLIVDDVQLLFQKHVELAQQELLEAVKARVIAAAAGIVAAFAAIFALAFLSSALAFGLETWMRPWVARLLVALLYLVIVAIAGAVAASRARKPSFEPVETKRMIEEDKEWAKAQLER